MKGLFQNLRNNLERIFGQLRSVPVKMNSQARPLMTANPSLGRKIGALMSRVSGQMGRINMQGRSAFGRFAPMLNSQSPSTASAGAAQLKRQMNQQFGSVANIERQAMSQVMQGLRSQRPAEREIWSKMRAVMANMKMKMNAAKAQADAAFAAIKNIQ